MVTTSWMRSATATGLSRCGQGPPGPMRRVKMAAVGAPLLAEEALLAAGAFVDGVLAAGPGGGDEERGGSWWRRRNAVLRHRPVQYCCRPAGVSGCWQAGQVIVSVSSRDGDPVTGHRPRGAACP